MSRSWTRNSGPGMSPSPATTASGRSPAEREFILTKHGHLKKSLTASGEQIESKEQASHDRSCEAPSVSEPRGQPDRPEPRAARLDLTGIGNLRTLKSWGNSRRPRRSVGSLAHRAAR